MSTISKQWLQQKIAEMEATRDEIPFGLDEADSNTLAALRIALASLEAEAVGEFYHEARWGWYEISEGDSVPERARIPLYRVPPAPVSVPAAMEMDDDFDSAFEHGKAVGWNACRAAMLQGAEPVTTDYKLPEGWVAVPVEPTAEMMAEAKRW
uniref:hypothetical protein n=1 Tax=Enterobacter roggenkampii TaxID=1812935 RepID=UPI003523B9F8